MDQIDHPFHFNHAGFWKRFAAYMIDAAILYFFILNFYWFFRAQIEFYLDNDALMGLDSNLFKLSTQYAMYGVMLWTIIFQWCYFAGFESSPLRATPGKLAIGLYVTDLKGERISFPRATGRHFAKIISGLIFLIGYLMAGFTEYSQALHDKISDCFVLSK